MHASRATLQFDNVFIRCGKALYCVHVLFGGIYRKVKLKRTDLMHHPELMVDTLYVCASMNTIDGLMKTSRSRQDDLLINNKMMEFDIGNGMNNKML